ncbi:bifunctional 2-polyprenyl-6-hydroxyphenol methylase/3-demethylubiquinol 3-O-methyltransferase UbiG [Desulfoluna sp.]|uniref:class I SAM-dependent methyltransferase n=1 Tax=Desulfoluna sp. TaxID=2045199 RepID=UPI002622EE6B|nr:class I SAM-dependent methyltransferase [Desulfoluna sp.]
MKANTAERWNDVWSKQVRKHNEIIQNDCGSQWQDRTAAKRFWEMTRKNMDHRLERTLSGFDLSANSRILDVGAGPGNLAIPMACRFAQVTAVEPAEGMTDLLTDHARAAGRTNIHLVQKRWEEVCCETDLLPPYDLVIASFSLGMENMKAAIEKMVHVSSRYVCLLWFAGETAWDKHSQYLWKTLHNTPYTPMPRCDTLYNLLYQMGIYPNMEVFTIDHDTVYDSLADAVDQSKRRYQIKNQAQETLLKNYLEKNLLEKDGHWIQKNSSTRVKIWWDVTSQNAGESRDKKGLPSLSRRAPSPIKSSIGVS